MSALPDSIRHQLDEFYSQLSGSGPAIYMWRELMSARDRRQMQRLVDNEPHDSRFDEIAGENLPQIDVEMNDGVAGRVLHRCFHRWGAVGIWMRLKGLSQPEAIVDLAYQRGLSQATYQRLLNAIGAKPPAKRGSKKPVWDRDEKTLRFQRSVLCRVRSLSIAKNLVVILDAFERRNWRMKIAAPLEGEALHEAVYSLNKKQKRIHFFACDDGASVGWGRRRSSSHRRVIVDRRG
jgi:hypothetical protein